MRLNAQPRISAHPEGRKSYLGFHPQTQKVEPQCKQNHRKVLLISFHLNGHTLGFYPQSHKLKPLCTAL